jgi:hypothetical protein
MTLTCITDMVILGICMAETGTGKGIGTETGAETEIQGKVFTREKSLTLSQYLLLTWGQLMVVNLLMGMEGYAMNTPLLHQKIFPELLLVGYQMI